MKPEEVRYVVYSMAMSGGVMVGLGVLVHPVVGVIYMIGYYVFYMNSPLLHRFIERISAGREKK